MTSPDALRVGTSLPAGKIGRAFSISEGSSRFKRRSRSTARSGFAAFHVANLASHSLCKAAPRSFTFLTWLKTSLGIANFSSGFRPSSFFVAATSSSPNAAPCDFAELRSFGAGQAITLLSLIKDGLLISAFASIIARSKLSISTLPSEFAATSITCQL